MTTTPWDAGRDLRRTRARRLLLAEGNDDDASPTLEAVGGTETAGNRVGDGGGRAMHTPTGVERPARVGELGTIQTMDVVIESNRSSGGGVLRQDGHVNGRRST